MTKKITTIFLWILFISVSLVIGYQENKYEVLLQQQLQPIVLASPNTIQQISAWLKEAKEIHEGWIYYLEAEDDEAARRKIEFYAGGIDYHQIWIERYEISIRELEKHRKE